MKNRVVSTLSVYAAAAGFALFLIFGLCFNAWPELSDSIKPELRLEGIAAGGRYSGLVAITFSVRDETTSVARVRMAVDGAPLYDKAIGQRSYFDGASLDTTALKEGEHTLVVSVIDGSLWRQLEERTIVFLVDHTSPRLDILFLKESVFQGDTGGLVIRADEALADLRLEAQGRKIPCHPLPGGGHAFRGLFAVSPFLAPGERDVVVAARDLAGNETLSTQQVTVVFKRFLSETIELPREKQGILRNPKKIDEDRVKIEAALAGQGNEQVWRGVFTRPAPGIDSSPFGIRRVYETGGVASSHRGIDIANKEGTPVVAANTGKILLAEELFVTGNTVILDHGQGVVSFYYHMKSLAVKQGDTAAQGDLLGLMGTTGLSTGSHCHWEMQVHRESVNPDDWTTHSFMPPQ